jgi:hypothetical protein
MHLSKIGVWCTVSRKRILGSFFFEYTSTVKTYENLLYQFISLVEKNERDCWFQHRPCCEHNTGDHIVGHWLWPPHCPDLTPADFVLWGVHKERVYSK